MPEWLDDAKRIDLAVYTAIARTEAPVLDIAMRRLSRAADHSKLWAAIAAVLVLCGGRNGRRAAAGGLASVGLASAFANLIAKPLTLRRRPERGELSIFEGRHVPMPHSTSFPSGHTASAFAFAIGAGHAAPALSMPLRATAAMVGYSRVHTGVHYPGDVLIGALIGVAAGELAGHLLESRS